MNEHLKLDTLVDLVGPCHGLVKTNESLSVVVLRREEEREREEGVEGYMG